MKKISADSTLAKTDWYTIKTTDDSYEYTETTPGVIILPVRAGRENLEVLIRKEPNPIYGDILTLVTGRTDDGETPLQTAVRELREEAGLILDEDCFYSIGDIFYRKSDATPEAAFIVICNHMKYEDPETDGSQYERDSKNSWIPISELDTLIQQSKDSGLLAVLAKFLSLVMDVEDNVKGYDYELSYF